MSRCLWGNSCILQGSHTSLVLVEHGYKVTAIDNLDNAFDEVLNRLKKLAGEKADNLNFVKVRIVSFGIFKSGTCEYWRTALHSKIAIGHAG